jgi:hypothetical protein
MSQEGNGKAWKHFGYKKLTGLLDERERRQEEHLDFVSLSDTHTHTHTLFFF